MTSVFHLVYWVFNPFSLVTIPYASYMIIYLRKDKELPAFYMLYGIYILVMGLSAYFTQVLFASTQKNFMRYYQSHHPRKVTIRRNGSPWFQIGYE